MKKKKFIFLLPVIAILGILLVLGKSLEVPKVWMKYSEFYQLVEQGEILAVQFSEDTVLFYKNGDETVYQTDNPQKQDFREFLLLHDIKIQKTYSVIDMLYAALDVLFYIFFFILIGVVVYKLYHNQTFRVVKRVDTTFDDVIGMQELKQEFCQVMDIMKQPQVYKEQGIRMPKGILLEGAPGNGKTLFARAAAGESRISFIPTKAADFESMFMAVGPMKVKQLFRLAKKHAPCIIFIDEFDGIGTRRSYHHTAMETENARIVTALLNEMDGFTVNEGILVIAATNHRKALDEALIRPGRFDRKYVVPYPDQKAREELIDLYTRKKKLAEDVDKQELAEFFDKCSCAKIETILNQAALIAQRRESKAIGRVEIMMALAEVGD